MNFSVINPNRKKAVFLAKKQLPELVFDVVNLEGVNYTLPEVQTLLDGVTVGGHSLQDETIALNQVQAWRFLFDRVEHGRFSLAENFVGELHGILAQKEALTWGIFRDGGVTIAGTDYRPPNAAKLPVLWEQLAKQHHLDLAQPMAQLQKEQQKEKQKNDRPNIEKIYTHAIGLFLQMARIQFFYDGNKRLGRLMMNGILLTNGLPVINLPASRKLEFNQLMLAFYPSNDMQPMQDFMLSCISEEIIHIMSE